jgi:hypothetical protein
MPDLNAIQSYLNAILFHITGIELTAIGPYFGFVLGMVFLPFFIYYKGFWTFGAKYLGILTYCWSLGLIVTIIAVYLAIRSGIVNEAGDPLNDIGRIVLWTAKGSVDPIGDLYLIVGFLCIVLGPQIISYMILALFGRAGNVYLFKTVTKLAVWSFIKTLATGSGIILAFSFLFNSSQLFDTILKDNPEYAAFAPRILAIFTSWIFLCSAALVTGGYSMLQYYFNLIKLINLTTESPFPRIFRLVSKIHSWAIRHQSDDLSVFDLVGNVMSATESLVTIYGTLKRATGRAPTNDELKYEWERSNPEPMLEEILNSIMSEIRGAYGDRDQVAGQHISSGSRPEIATG